MRRGRRGQRGQVLIIFVLITPLVIGMLGLVVDLGITENMQGVAQNGVDAAALADAQNIAANPFALNYVPAETAGNNAATTNLAGASVTYGYFAADNTTTVNTPVATVYVHASLTASRQTYFMAVFGVASQNVAASAQARIPVPVCGLCTLGAGTSLAWSDSSSLVGLGDWFNVTGVVDSNGNMTTAKGLLTTDSLTSTSLLVHGTSTTSGGGFLFPWVYAPAATTGAALFTDPLSNFNFATNSNVTNAASTLQSAVMDSITTNTTLSPGYYYGITVSNSVTVTLNPGTYYIGGGGVTGGAPAPPCFLCAPVNNLITGTGVTIALGCGASGAVAPTACPAGGAGSGGISMGSTTAVSLTAPSSGLLNGMQIFADPRDTATLSFPAINLNATPLQGAIYAPAATLTMTMASGLVALFNTVTVNSMIDVGTCNIGMGAVAAAIVRAFNIDTRYHPPGTVTLSS